jgi:hypothetical protein
LSEFTRLQIAKAINFISYVVYKSTTNARNIIYVVKYIPNLYLN